MKRFKCPQCKREKEVKDNCVIVICPCCLVGMKEVEDEREERE